MTCVLRKARILAAGLNNKAFEEWIRQELDGYPDDADLPAYRIIRVNAKAHLVLGRQHWASASVMASQIPEPYREWATTGYLAEPISHYAALVADADAAASTLRSEWPQEVAVKYGGSGYNHPQCISAWQEIPRAAIVALIETVRNRLLDFVLEIEAENPEAGEALPNTQPVAADKVQQLVNNYFGSVGNIAQQARGFTQTANVQIQPGDLNTLVTELDKHLHELKLDERQTRTARVQIATLKAQLEDQPDQVIVEQAGRTLRSIIEGAVASLLATAGQPAVWQTIHRLLAFFPRK